MADWELTPDYPLKESPISLTSESETNSHQRQFHNIGSTYRRQVWTLAYKNRPKTDWDLAKALESSHKGRLLPFTWLHPKEGTIHTVRLQGLVGGTLDTVNTYNFAMTLEEEI